MSVITTKGRYVMATHNTGNTGGVSNVTYNTTSLYENDNRITPKAGIRRKKPTGEWLYPTAYERIYEVHKEPRGHASTWRVVNVPKSKDRPAYQYIVTVNYDGVFGAAVTQGGGIQFSPSSQNLKTKAEIGALLKLKDSKVNLGVAMGEAQKTADFVGEVAGRLGRSLLALKRGSYKQAAKYMYPKPKRKPKAKRRFKQGRLSKQRKPNAGLERSRLVPRSLLEWQYAAAPLLNDVKGSIEELQRTQDSDWVVTVKKGTKEASERTVTRTATDANPLSRVLRNETAFLGYFVRLDAYPGNEFLATLNRVGVVNPLPVVWELIPLSFVWDWFMPVGEWLESMDAAYGFEFLSGSCTELKKSRWEYKPHQQGSLLAPWNWGTSNFSGYWKGSWIKRTVYSSFPHPILPRVKNPLSLVHMASGLALLHSAVYGTKMPKFFR